MSSFVAAHNPSLWFCLSLNKGALAAMRNMLLINSQTTQIYRRHMAMLLVTWNQGRVYYLGVVEDSSADIDLPFIDQDTMGMIESSIIWWPVSGKWRHGWHRHLTEECVPGASFKNTRVQIHAGFNIEVSYQILALLLMYEKWLLRML